MHNIVKRDVFDSKNNIQFHFAITFLLKFRETLQIMSAKLTYMLRHYNTHKTIMR